MLVDAVAAAEQRADATSPRKAWPIVKSSTVSGMVRHPKQNTNDPERS